MFRDPVFLRGNPRPVFVLCTLLVIAVGLPPAMALAAAFAVSTTVDAPDDTPGDGVCSSLVVIGPPVGFPPLPQLGFRCTLRGAIQEANAAAGTDLITVPGGIFQIVGVQQGLDDELAATDDLDLLDSVVIQGAGADLTILSASGGDLFEVLGTGAFDFYGMTFDGGVGVMAIRNHSGEILLDSVLSNGCDAVVTTPTLDPASRVTVRDSELSSIGGVSGSRVVIERSLFEGGTVNVTGTDVTVLDSTFENAAFGVIGTPGGQIHIEGSTLRDHSTAVSAFGDQVRILNSTLSGNGVGLSTTPGSMALLDFVTIFDSFYDGLEASGNVALDHSVIAGSGGDDCDFHFGATLVSRYSMDSDGSCGLVDPTDLPSGDPGLLPLADNGGPTLTHAMATTSPLRDGGDAVCAATNQDQRGFARPRGNACDVGAVEAKPPATCGLGIELTIALPALIAWRRRLRNIERSPRDSETTSRKGTRQ